MWARFWKDFEKLGRRCIYNENDIWIQLINDIIYMANFTKNLWQKFVSQMSMYAPTFLNNMKSFFSSNLKQIGGNPMKQPYFSCE